MPTAGYGQIKLAGHPQAGRSARNRFDEELAGGCRPAADAAIRHRVNWEDEGSEIEISLSQIDDQQLSALPADHRHRRSRHPKMAGLRIKVNGTEPKCRPGIFTNLNSIVTSDRQQLSNRIAPSLANDSLVRRTSSSAFEGRWAGFDPIPDLGLTPATIEYNYDGRRDAADQRHARLRAGQRVDGADHRMCRPQQFHHRGDLSDSGGPAAAGRHRPQIVRELASRSASRSWASPTATSW